MGRVHGPGHLANGTGWCQGQAPSPMGPLAPLQCPEASGVWRRAGRSLALLPVNAFLSDTHLRNEQSWEVQWGRSGLRESMKDL